MNDLVNMKAISNVIKDGQENAMKDSLYKWEKTTINKEKKEEN